MHYSAIRTTHLVWAACAALLLIALGLFTYSERRQIEYAHEDIMLALHPSAELAFAYAERHFNATSPGEYDVNRAYDLFSRARELDPQHPFVYHELARIEFLRSNFPYALFLINMEFAVNPHPSPASYYVRALIEGFMQQYTAAASDYETYFKVAPANWASINDYSWVLLKADRPADALYALSWGLKAWPHNAWLLTNEATALYELGQYKEAAAVAAQAQVAVAKLTPEDWYTAYPGNDPAVAGLGLSTFQNASAQNLAQIVAAAASSTQASTSTSAH